MNIRGYLLCNNVCLLSKFLRKSLSDQVLFLEAVFWLGISRISILILPFRWIAPFLGRHMASSNDDLSLTNIKKAKSIAQAILSVSRHLPWECKCLNLAISGKMILRRKRIPNTLYLGVAKNKDGNLIAHAWIRAGDIIILGGSNSHCFEVVSKFA